jgi:hypothetical protein
MDLRERVFACLNGMAQNGHDMQEDAALIACDLLAKQQFETLSDEDAADLQDYIIEWQESFS